MDYDLTRIDYAICGITFPDTLKILPAPGPKTQQKFAIGDKNGVLQCLGIRDEEAVVQFKSLPGKPITSVQLAATAGTYADKIFAASGNEVKGYTRKGKVFLTIETSLSETITSMCVLGGDLVLGSGRMVTHYRDLREYHTYTCDDRVLDVTVFAAPNQNARLRLLVLIANKGAILFEGGQETARVTVSSGPSRIAVAPYSHPSDVCALYGSADGSIGLIIYNGSELTSRTLVEGRSLGPVMCLGWFFNDSGPHLAVGRHDGSIQLYLVEMENLAEKPRLKFTYFCGEPVTSVCGGCIGTEDSELLAATFSGRIFALRSRRFLSSTSSMNVSQDALAGRRSKLEVDVARLEKQVANEREKYQRNTRTLSTIGVSAPPLLDIQCELSGATRDGWQEARVTSAVPLDMLFIYSTRTLDLETDSAAVLSVCPPQMEPSPASDLLATVRCQAGTRRLWLRVRYHKATNQPTSTRLLIYALPAGAPRVARLITLKLPALPYYSKHEEPDVLEKEQRSWCQLKVSGTFSVAEMTSWLTEALPGELPRPSTTVAFGRSHVLLHTNLTVRYQKGQATFKSENVSTAVTLRDLISNCSVEKNIRIDIKCETPKNCCVNHFSIIEDQFKNEYRKHQDDVMKKALRSLDLDSNAAEEENTILCDEFIRLSKSLNDPIETNFDEFVETVERWYDDWRSLQLHHHNDSFNEKSLLANALRNCQIDQIKKIFRTQKKVESYA